MSLTSPSNGSSGTGKSPEVQFKVVRKRNRVPLSCAPCRHRKLKCNRGHPCDNCTRRRDHVSCAYSAPTSRRKAHAGNGLSTIPDEMQTRIDRLEGLVLSLITNNGQPGGTKAANKVLAQAARSSEHFDEDGPECEAGHLRDQDEVESEVDEVAESVGIMKVDNDKPTFASEVHWYAILSEISEVKTYFAEHKKQFEDQLKRVTEMACLKEKPGSAFLLRANLSADRSTISLAFPPKVVADLLIEKYFNSYDPGVHIIHGPTFQKQYDKHWANPNDTRFMWYGLVLSMMTLALQSYHQLGEEPPELNGRPALELSVQYRRLTAQCLILEDYTNPSSDAIETIILHLQAEAGRSRDCESGIIIIVGILVRLAFRMGYHRDAKPYPSISPFQGEMRRRVWAYVRAADVLFSYQAGHPSLIRPCNTNTQLPSNLYDDELDENMRALPMSRPMSEATPTSFIIARGKLLESIGRIDEYSLSLTMTNYDEVMKLDESLREARAAMPSYFRMKPPEESAKDPPQLCLQRVILDLLYLKGQCILHRRFLNRGRENARFNHSRQTCINASLAVVEHQVTLHKQSQPGGKFVRIAWYNVSLNGNDFLIAAMIIVLDLYNTIEAELKGKTSADDLYTWSLDRRAAMFAALENAVGIWASFRDVSIEAWKAHTAISIMLGKLKAYSSQQQQQRQVKQAQPLNVANEVSGLAPEHSAAMTLGMLSAGGMVNDMSNGISSYDIDQDQSIEEQHSQILPQMLQAQQQEQNPFILKTQSLLTDQEQQRLAQVGNVHQRPLSLPCMPMNGVDMGTEFDFDWNTWDSFLHGPAGLDPTSSGFWPSSMDGNGYNGYVNSNDNINDDGGFQPTTTSGANASTQQHNGAAYSHQQKQPQQQEAEQIRSFDPPSTANLDFSHGILRFGIDSRESQGPQGPQGST